MILNVYDFNDLAMLLAKKAARSADPLVRKRGKQTFTTEPGEFLRSSSFLFQKSKQTKSCSFFQRNLIHNG